MPTFTVPHSYGTFQEFNRCHNPGGSAAGGQFCSDQGASGVLGVYRRTLRRDRAVAVMADEIRASAPTRLERRLAEMIAKAEIDSAEDLKYGDSKTQNLDAQGVYNDTRRALHRKLLKEVVAGKPTGLEQPVAVLMGGMTAAGKTTTVEKGLDKSDKVYINSDDFKEKLPEYNGHNAAFVHEESGDLADAAFFMAIERRQNLILDSTMKSLGGSTYEQAKGDGGLAAKIEKLKQAGYRVEIRFVDVDVETAVERSMRRFAGQELRKGGGRYVPANVIRSNRDPKFGTKPRKTFEQVKDQVDAYIIYDGRGNRAKKRVLGRKGQLTK